jgi:hypothetical protein
VLRLVSDVAQSECADKAARQQTAAMVSAEVRHHARSAPGQSVGPLAHAARAVDRRADDPTPSLPRQSAEPVCRTGGGEDIRIVWHRLCMKICKYTDIRQNECMSVR